jgi:hypothetical protein
MRTKDGAVGRWLGRQSSKRLGYLGKLRWAGAQEEELQPISWELHRRRHGLEARALVALVMAPEVLDEARGSLELRQLLTAPYVLAAALLLDAETPASARERARADLAARSYIPDGSDIEGWAAEARACIAELRARRARWDERVADRHVRRTAAARGRRGGSARRMAQ